MGARVVPVVAALVCGALSCHGGGSGGEQEVDVYVPAPVEAGVDAGPDGSGFGVGQVDRAGHPLVTVLLVPSGLQDEYNAQPTFEPAAPRILQDALEARLVAFDTLALGDAGPDPVDWPVPDGGTHPLLPMLLGDVLLVDTSVPCTSADGGFSSSYLDLDREAYAFGPTHTTCGGRTPNDGVVDTTLTLLVQGPDASAEGRAPVTQGVAGPTKLATTTFPYLAPPN